MIRVCSSELLGRQTWLYKYNFYLATDSDDRVLVCDSRNSRVLLLNSRLELERVLLDTEQLKQVQNPSRLCLDEQAGLLIVASDSIQFYNIIFTTTKMFVHLH